MSTLHITKNPLPRFGLAQSGKESEAMRAPSPSWVKTSAWADFHQNVVGSRQALSQTILKGQPARDYQLGAVDHYSKLVGGATIAGLATAGLPISSRSLGIHEFVGLASWLAAMKIARLPIWWTVQAKTGYNLNQAYQTLDGVRQPFHLDPGYMPMNLLPQPVLQKLARQFEISTQDPTWQMLVEQRVRQISVQAHTVWMLTAGLMTPILASVFSDRLQGHAVSLFRSAKMVWHDKMAERAIQKDQPQKAVKHVEAYVRQWVGKDPASKLSAWWQQFDRDLVSHTGLLQTLKPARVLEQPQTAIEIEILKTFKQMASNPPVLDQLSHYLQKQQNVLTMWEEKLSERLKKQIETYTALQSDATVQALRHEMRLRIVDAASTITHYQDALQALKTGDLKQMVEFLDKPGVPEVNRKVMGGFVQEAELLVGKSRPGLWQEVLPAIRSKQFGKVAQLLGASPMHHLVNALKDSAHRSRWLKGYVLYPLAAITGATLAFVVLFVGRLPKADLSKKPQGNVPS